MIRLIVVAGARPNFMKIAPLMGEMAKRPDLTVRLVHTGQHYDARMSQLFFDELTLWPERGEAPATVTIRPDWYDNGPREGELPRMHYRVNVRPADRAFSGRSPPPAARDRCTTKHARRCAPARPDGRA